ncbi:hypothetical protein CDFC105_84026 [Clostridioides difficile]|nr:hypothetical protein CDFC105_84026 [Clostridioides difficile]
MDIIALLLFLGVIIFFFQAENGIRNVERSRGLGDVYKRQGIYNPENKVQIPEQFDFKDDSNSSSKLNKIISNISSVSYTHLTLPTTPYV